MDLKYNVSDTLLNMLESASPHDSKLAYEMLTHYKREYERVLKESNKITAAFNFHRLIEEYIKIQFEQPQALDVKCTKGCAYCCEQIVDITEDEALLIIDFIKEEKIKFDQHKLIRQSKYSIDDWSTQTKYNRTCVFLDKENSCKIYEHRSASCRKLFVLTEPEMCNIQKINKVGRFVNAHVEIIASAPLNVVYSDSMPKLITKILKLK